MIRNKEIMVDEIWYRYHLACEVEAIVMGLPPDAGTHIFLATLIDLFEDWDDEDFQFLLELIKKEFGKNVLYLYLKCSKLFNSYRKLNVQKFSKDDKAYSASNCHSFEQFISSRFGSS